MEINYKQLTFAREYRGYSQTELSSNIDGLSQSNLSKFEKGVSTLSYDLVQKIINFLEFPVGFFKQNISNQTETAHFRKRSVITKKTKTRIELSYRLIGYIVDEMEVSIDWPSFKLRTFDLEDGFTPETVAKYTRKYLGLKYDEPVKNIFNLLETNGIIIVELDETEKFDGVSFVSDKGFPVIVINKNFSNDRKRFTIAHELGHLLMHSVNNPAIPEYRVLDIEKEANSFASEFLMPALAVKNSLYDLRLSYLSELKRYWLTSMASIIKRALDLGCISKDKSKYFNIELSRKGWRKKEPGKVFIDEPKLFYKGYRMHKDELDYSDKELTEAFNIPLDVINKYCIKPRNKTKLQIMI